MGVWEKVKTLSPSLSKVHGSCGSKVNSSVQWQLEVRLCQVLSAPQGSGDQHRAQQVPDPKPIQAKRSPSCQKSSVLAASSDALE